MYLKSCYSTQNQKEYDCENEQLNFIRAGFQLASSLISMENEWDDHTHVHNATGYRCEDGYDQHVQCIGYLNIVSELFEFTLIVLAMVSNW